MNKVIVMGRLTRDPEVRWTSGDQSVCLAKFGIAVDRRNKSKENPQVDFFDVDAWGKLAEHIEKYWKKGMKALIAGRLEYQTWTDRNGAKKSSVKIVAEEIDFTERKEVQETSSDFVPVSSSEEEELPFTL